MSVISKLADAISPNGPSNAATIGRDGLIRPSIYDRHHFRTLGAAVAIVVAIPLFVSGIYGMGVATSCGLFAILSLGFYYQFALSGQFSFATSGFYGIGAFTSIWASKDFGFVGGILAAVVVCAIIGAFLKVLLARSPLIQFGIATLSATSLAIIVLRNWDSLSGSGAGKFGVKPVSLFGRDFTSPTEQYYAVWAVALIGIFLLILFERSAARRDLVFARDMGAVARTSGLKTGPIFIVAFAIGAGYMGAAGSLFAHTNRFAQIDSFTIVISLDVLLMVLLGGTASVWGPPLGAIALVIVPEYLRSVPELRDLVFAGIILLVILVLPGGLASIPSRVQQVVAKRRRTV